MKKVSVIILNFKLKDYVLKCIASVERSSYKNIELIIIDNNSNDGIEEEVSKLKRSSIEFIQNGTNSGFTGGYNVGIKKALEKNSDYIFILNPDTEIDQKAIEYLVTGLEDHQAGIANPKIYFADSKTIWFAGGILDINNVLGSNRGVDEEDKGQFDKEEEIALATGCALMVKKEVFEKIGLLDERFFLYYEDTDFSYRAKLEGIKIVYLPKAIVYHANAKTTGLGTPLQDYFITRNRLLFASKYLSFRTKFALIREILRNFKYPARRLALKDFLTGNFGKGSFIRDS